MAQSFLSVAWRAEKKRATQRATGPILALVGSFELDAVVVEPLVRAAIESRLPRAILVGGHRGLCPVGKIAARLADHEFHLPLIAIYPGMDAWTARFEPTRGIPADQLVALFCDVLVLFSCRSSSYEPGWARDLAVRAGKVVEEIEVS